MTSAKYRIENFKAFYIAFAILIAIVFFGIFGYMGLEGFSFSEAFFMTIITISTVGFQEVKPLSQTGQFFTAFLIIISFGTFAYAVGTLTRYIVDGVFHNYLKDNKVKKQIEKITNHVVVCGYGRNGRQSVEELSSYNLPVIIIDKNPEIVEELRLLKDVLYVEGDATQDEIMEAARISKARALITALPNDADNLFVVLTAREMNKEMTIISRAADANSDKKLKSAGATNVIMPDKIGGQRMAKLVAQPDVVEFLDYILLQTNKSVFIEEISCKEISESFTQKSIGEWGIRSVTGANIIGVKRADKSYQINPSANLKIGHHDQLFVLGNHEQIGKLRKILRGEQIK